MPAAALQAHLGEPGAECANESVSYADCEATVEELAEEEQKHVMRWASDRAQVLSRTVRGVMRYGDALRVLARLEERRDARRSLVEERKALRSSPKAFAIFQTQLGVFITTHTIHDNLVIQVILRYF